MFCGKCGNQIRQGKKFCGACGTPVTIAESTEPQIEKPEPRKPNNKKIIIIVIISVIVFLISAICVIIPLFIDNDNTSVDDNIYQNDDKYENDNDIDSTTDITDFVPDNAISYNGHYYCVYSLKNFSDWDSVETFCSEMNGYPATISSKEENEFLHNYLKENYSYNNVYFGLVNNINSNMWKWTNNEKLSYTNWANDNSIGNYAAFSPLNPNGTWKETDFISKNYNDICVETISATSVLSEKTNIHYAERVFDNDVSTAWVEGAQGNGIGESLTINFDKNYIIDGIEINSGYQKDAEHYLINSRPNRIKLTYSDGTSEFYILADLFDAQWVMLNNPVVTDKIVLTLDTVYPGTIYEDTAISEIGFNEYQDDNYFICEWGEYNI